MGSKIIIFLLLILSISGCSNKTYTVTFNTDGGSHIEDIHLSKGETLENIDLPTKEGYLFVSWLKEFLSFY